MANLENYYIGLDCGTSSVGWAVTDENYNIPRLKGQRAWGARLFDEALPAAERRTHRSARRRNARAKNRIKLLNMLFRDEILPLDPDFYTRLRESFYLEEDKLNLSKTSKNTLFNDQNYTDKDFHHTYPTIWHLRQAIIKNPDQKFDIRLYYLAIHHILKNRGHFLYSGKIEGSGDFTEIYLNLVDVAEKYNFILDDSDFIASEAEKILTDKNIKLIDKKKQLADLIFIETDEPEDEDAKLTKSRLASFAGLLAGSKVSYPALFDLDTDESGSYSFADNNFEEKIDADIPQLIGEERLDLILAAKRIYDYVILKDLLGDNRYISDAMVANYLQHQKDLKALKQALKPFPEDYRRLFKAEIHDEKFPSYNAYIGKAYTVDKSGRKKTARVDQDTLNKHLVKVLESHQITGDLLDRAANGQLLPKQKGQAKGTIPMQLHHTELELILNHLAKDYPSFANPNPSEPEKYNTKLKKILSIHSFRIPYYCGPLPKRKYNDNGEAALGGKSEFSWGDEEITQLVYPWNFNDLVNLDQRATNFIRRMTNECTYLIGEDVLPKASLLYQKYMVLNELNNLKINGKRITDVEFKQKIYQAAFADGELQGNVRLKGFSRWLVNNGFISPDDELGGTNEAKVLPRLKTHLDFLKMLGVDYAKKYSSDKLEEVIETITVLGEEKTMLRRRIQAILNCNDDIASKLAKLSYREWGNFSAKFLVGVIAPVNGVPMNILDALYYTNHNLMELLSGEFGYTKAITDHNDSLNTHSQKELTYQDVKELYCSPAVKRTIWQAIKIVKEITKAAGRPPQKIFLEVTRSNENDKTKARNAALRLRRQEQILSSYKSAKDIPPELINSLKSHADRDLQSKKLYLYYTQMGRCAYSGEKIDIESLHTSAYDIDHIYPRSLTKDDSITRNLVLVKAKYNREKSNTYPINPTWRSKMLPTWQSWLLAGLITKEKYNRLSRSDPLTLDELSGFIARQLVETSQSVKAIGKLLQRAYPNTRVITVKAGQVSDFRHLFSQDKKEPDSHAIIKKGQYEFIKIRELNDYHHAKDAYLNIVVGNVMDSTFTSNPYEWLKKREGKSYSINPRTLFRPTSTYKRQDGTLTDKPIVKAWDFQSSIDIISSTMQRNDILWTRMTNTESGQLSDQQLSGKSNNNQGFLPIKQSQRLANVSRYGGYNSVKGAYVSLIEFADKNGSPVRRLVQIPIARRQNPEAYIKETYNGKIIIPVIPFMSYLKLNGFPLHISGRTGNSIIFYHAVQITFHDPDILKYIKAITSVNKKVKGSRGSYIIDEERDGVSKEQNLKLFDSFLDKLKLFTNMPLLGSKIPEIIEHKDDFTNLDLDKQCEALGNFLNVFTCSATTGDLSSFVPKASFVGKGITSDNLNNYDTAELIHRSPTGLYQEKINLKEIQ